MPAILCIPEKRFYTHDRQGVIRVKNQPVAQSLHRHGNLRLWVDCGVKGRNIKGSN